MKSDKLLYDRIMESIDLGTKLALKDIPETVSYPLLEGIDFDDLTKEVWYVPEEINVETSVQTNPTVFKDIKTDIEVWSFFKRKRSDKDLELDAYDGNPLLYALKNEKQWHFRTNRDKHIIVSLFEMLLKKFFNEHRFNVTVVMPSGSGLNTLFTTLIQTVNRNAYIITDMLRKLSCSEVWDILNDDHSEFKMHFGKSRDSWDSAKAYINAAFRRMDKEMKGYFSYRLLPEDPNNYRDYITKTLALEDWSQARYAYDLFDKDILLIDDAMSRGASIWNACEIIDTFKPKSITVFTFFSKNNTE